MVIGKRQIDLAVGIHAAGDDRRRRHVATPEVQTGQRRPGLPGRRERQRGAHQRAALPRHRPLRGQVGVGGGGLLRQVGVAAVRDEGVGLAGPLRADPEGDLSRPIGQINGSSGGGHSPNVKSTPATASPVLRMVSSPNPQLRTTLVGDHRWGGLRCRVPPQAAPPLLMLSRHRIARSRQVASGIDAFPSRRGPG